MRLAGLVVPLPTLFDDGEGVDPERNREFAASLVRAGVPHLFPLGSLGEFPSLEADERRTLLRAVSDGVGGSADLWTGVGAPSTRQALGNVRAAIEFGATVVIATPPYYLSPTEAEIATYYRAIARDSPVPVLAYNIPAKVGYALRPELVHSLAREKVLAGIKDTSGSFESVRAFLADAPADFAVLPGDDLLARASVRAGAPGAVMGLANILPRLARAVLEGAAHGPPDPRPVDRDLEALAQVVASGPFPATVKFLAHRLRGAPDGYRAPYGPLSGAEEARLLATLAPHRERLAAWE